MLDLTATGVASYSGDGSDPPPGAEVVVEVGAAESVPVASISATQRGSTVVEAGEGIISWPSTLTASAEALADLRSPPVIASLWLSLTARMSDEHAQVGVETHLGEMFGTDELLGGGYLSGQTSQEWLGLCEQGRRCALPVSLRFRPEAGTVTVDWTLEASIEYVGLGMPPAGATLTLTPD